jgi:biopolymer transport protein ExbB
MRTLTSLLNLLIVMMVCGYCHAQQASSDSARAKTLDELLQIVTNNKQADSIANQKRVREFEQKRNQQAALLQKSKDDVLKQERISEQYNTQISDNERALGELETQLAERLGNFGELFGVTRQVAGDTRAQIENSLISAQFPGREQALNEITNSKALPTMEQLRGLWLVLLQEQTEQAKVAKFNANVNDEQGYAKESEIIRLGPFTAMSNGKFLVYNNETNQLTTLSRQPGYAFSRTVATLEQAPAGETVSAVVDPSRGTILGLLVQTPNLLERFNQGGLVGYTVSVLAVIGLIIGLQRLLSLWLTTARVNRQIKNKTIDTSNPLGRVLQAYEENPAVDLNTLELKLDDAVLKEVPKLDRGLNTLKVLAAVAPLMGLLGTVIGMILTFQAITLWGTGDPKLMAGGISQALMTTVQGLVAAIPLLLLHSVANGRARLVQQVLEEQSAGLVAKRAEYGHG